MKVRGQEVRVQGSLIRIARLEATDIIFWSIRRLAVELRTMRIRIDLFTFMQRLPETRRSTRTRWSGTTLAALPVSTFEHWWRANWVQARNKAKQAEKKGVIVREVPFDDTLVKGIWEIYNECPVRQGGGFPIRQGSRYRASGGSDVS